MKKKRIPREKNRQTHGNKMISSKPNGMSSLSVNSADHFRKLDRERPGKKFGHLFLKSTEYYQKNYIKLGKLGDGGFGTVWKGFRTGDAMPVAIKEIKSSKVTQWGDLNGQAVPMEAIFLIKLKPIKGVIQILDLCQQDDVYIIVMERPKKAKDLFDLIEERRRLEGRDARKIFKQVVETLQACRRHGVFHGDVKDENILVDTENKSAKLVDFGGAMKWTDKPYKKFMGTGLWSPPECNMKEDFYADGVTVWSLGCLLHAMLAGDIPFKSKIRALQGHFDIDETIRDGRAVDLIERCFALDTMKRITLNELSRHPWLKNRELKARHWRSEENRRSGGEWRIPRPFGPKIIRKCAEEMSQTRSFGQKTEAVRPISAEEWLRARMNQARFDDSLKPGETNRLEQSRDREIDDMETGNSDEEKRDQEPRQVAGGSLAKKMASGDRTTDVTISCDQDVTKGKETKEDNSKPEE